MHEYGQMHITNNAHYFYSTLQTTFQQQQWHRLSQTTQIPKSTLLRQERPKQSLMYMAHRMVDDREGD